MNLNNVLTRNYVKWTLGERKKNEPKTKPNKAKLKKAKMNLTLYLTRAYENKPRFQTIESKPKAKPIQSQANPISNPALEWVRGGYPQLIVQLNAGRLKCVYLLFIQIFFSTLTTSFGMLGKKFSNGSCRRGKTNDASAKADLLQIYRVFKV